MAEVVFGGVNDGTNLQGELFKGTKFWLSLKVPQRSRFINEIRANGGEVSALEKNADIKIVDHARKEALPGTHSYSYIERSIRNGVLEDLADHVVGPPTGTVRNVGSVSQPPKETRKKYTSEDDRILLNWVNANPQKGGGTKGNEIYKQLESKHPQHPWQSWRDRYIHQLQGRAQPFALLHNAPPTPPLDLQAPTNLHDPPQTASDPDEQAPTHDPPQTASDPDEDDRELFTEEDAQTLLEVGEQIMDLAPENSQAAWETWAESDDGNRSAEEWQDFWKNHVRPRFLKRRSKRIEKRRVGDGPVLDAPQKTKSTLPYSPEKPPSVRPPKQPYNHPTTIKRQSPELPISHPETHGRDTNKSPAYPILTPSKLLNVSSEGSRSLKRKPSAAEEEFPSSSPPETSSLSKRARHTASNLPREIASTPDSSPISGRKNRYSPLFVPQNDEQELIPDSPGEHDGILGKAPSESLSEPERSRRTTQHLFHDSPPPLGFSIPPPDEGWDDEEPPNTSTPNTPKPKVIPDTQTLFNETQLPDFTIPSPTGGWEAINYPPTSPHTPPSPSTKSTTSSSINIPADIDAWIDSLTDDRLSSEQVETALKCASMDSELAKRVIETWKAGGEMPGDWRGVWTEEDDRALRSGDARGIRRLEVKHGGDAMGVRFEFLEFWEEVGG